MPGSKAERRLQIDPPDCAACRERSSLQAIRNVKEVRAKNAARIAHVHLVKDVANVDTKREVVAPIRAWPTHRWTASEQRTTRAATSSVTASRSTRSSALGIRALFQFGAQPKRLGQPEI